MRAAMLVVLTGCSQILGIGGFQVGDAGGDAGPAFAQRAYLKASNPDPGDNFGVAVALSADGTTLAVAASQEASAAAGVDGDQTSNAKAAAGAVYVFARTGDTWAQQAYLKASNPDAMDQFGRSLSLSADGNTLAVGADGEASIVTGVGGIQTGNTAAAAGAVYLFARANAAWSQTTYIKASNTGAADHFGYAVALSGDGATLAVGAPLEDGATPGINGVSTETASSAGAAYIFALGPTTWAQAAYVKASNPTAADRFGNALALSFDGATLAVAAPFEDSASKGVNGNQSNELATDAGAVYVFTHATTWAQQAYVKASNTEANDRFGIALALSADGNTLAVGADGDDSPSATTPDDNTATDSGAVHLFTRAGTAWSQAAFVKAAAPATMDSFGAAVALSPTRLVVGAPNELSSTGALALFDLANPSAPLAHLTATNANPGDKLGASVAASTDGFAAGAPAEDSSSAGVDGDGSLDDAADSGAAYLF